MSKDTLDKLLKAEYDYLLSRNWKPIVGRKKGKVKWVSPMHGTIIFQGRAVKEQREIDLGSCA